MFSDYLKIIGGNIATVFTHHAFLVPREIGLQYPRSCNLPPARSLSSAAPSGLSLERERVMSDLYNVIDAWPCY
jgi:hypothetical protein